jgi:hypothetical protein
VAVDVNHYEVLGVPRTADLATIRAAYRRRARTTHPDLGGDPDEFAAVTTAWWTLSAPDRRARYDAGDDADWGDSLGWDEPAPKRAGTARTRSDDDRTGRPTPPVALIRDQLDAFTARPLPLPDDSELRARFRTLDPRVSGWAVLAWCAAVLLIILAPMVLSAFTTVSYSGLLTGIILYSTVLGSALILRGYTRWKGPAVRFFAACCLWGTVGLYALAATAYLSEPPTTAVRTSLTVAPGVVGVTAAALAGRRVRRVRRAVYDRSRWKRDRAVAEQWNRLLGERLQHGTTRIEPATRGNRPVWILVDGATGRELAWAPAQAPTAWAALLRQAGFDVRPTPGETPAPEPVAGRR